MSKLGHEGAFQPGFPLSASWAFPQQPDSRDLLPGPWGGAARVSDDVKNLVRGKLRQWAWGEGAEARLNVRKRKEEGSERGGS